MHKIENKSLWKEEMSYGGDAWYMGRIYKELKITLVLGYFPFALLIRGLIRKVH